MRFIINNKIQLKPKLICKPFGWCASEAAHEPRVAVDPQKALLLNYFYWFKFQWFRKKTRFCLIEIELETFMQLCYRPEVNLETKWFNITWIA